MSLMFLLLTLNIFTSFSSVSIVDFEQVNVSRETECKQYLKGESSNYLFS